MVHEIALEPELVASWNRPEEQALVRESMGLGNPRVLSGFPNIAEWRKAVFQAVGALKPVERTRFEVFVQQMSLISTYRRGAQFNSTISWDVNAAAEHVRMPFAGIICRQKTSSATSSADVIWDNAAPWSAHRGCPVPRRGEDFARELAPLVRVAWSITIVDPHFDPAEERFAAPLEAFLKEATKWRSSEAPNVNAALLTTERSSAKHFQELAKRIPTGLRLKIVRYEAREEKDHNRYLLTELGGVSFGTGVDQGSPRETDDLLLLSPEVWTLRTRQYVQRNEGFQFDLVTTVVGTKRLV